MTIDNSSRLSSLKRSLESHEITRILEAHSPIAAIIAEQSVDKSSNAAFHGFWSSSLADSMMRGMPDSELLSARSRLEWVNSIFDVTHKPLIVDGDTGGPIEHFGDTIRVAERAGVSAVVIEDKTGVKRNSLLEDATMHQLADAEDFAKKISFGKAQQQSKDFMIFARLEGLILGHSVDDLRSRAWKFVDAGADGIVIHSKSRDTSKLFEVSSILRSDFPERPLAAIPSAYPHVTEANLSEVGFNLVIYANHMIRSSVAAMEKVAKEILRFGRALEADDVCVPISRLLELDNESPGTF